MSFRPIVVLGTGRSGTSTVCRLLHEHFHVTMYARDREFIAADRFNPRGYFEDSLVKRVTAALVAGAMKPKKAAQRLYGAYNTAQPWGFKVIPLGDMPPDTLKLLSPSAVIVCTRDREAVVRSMAAWRRSRRWDDTEKAVGAEYDRRSTAIKGLVHGWQVLSLDFSVPRTDEELIALLASYLFERKALARTA